MKKITNIRKKSSHQKKYIRNPDWKDLNINERENVMDSLINENIVLCIMKKFGIKNSIREGSTWNNFNGTLKKLNSHTKLTYNKYEIPNYARATPRYLFEFNPLNQHLYQSREEYLEQRLKSFPNINSYNEDHSVDELDLLFNKEYYPTYKFEFYLSWVIDIHDNEIYLSSTIKFEPVLI